MTNHLPHDWFPRPLPENVTVGPRSWCYSSFAFCHYQSQRPAAVRIGSDTGIYNGTFFDLGPEGQVEVGNYCTLVGAIICTNRRITISDYSFIAHEVVLADGPFGTSESETTDSDAPTISLGENTWVGARAVLLGGAHLGEGAIVGAAAVVAFEVPPYAIVAGNPAKIVGWAKPSGRQA